MENWEKEIISLEMEIDGCLCYHHSIKSLIPDLLKAERAKIIKDIKSMKMTSGFGVLHVSGYNQAVDDIIHKIKKL